MDKYKGSTRHIGQRRGTYPDTLVTTDPTSLIETTTLDYYLGIVVFRLLPLALSVISQRACSVIIMVTMMLMNWTARRTKSAAAAATTKRTRPTTRRWWVSSILLLLLRRLDVLVVVVPSVHALSSASSFSSSAHVPKVRSSLMENKDDDDDAAAAAAEEAKVNDSNPNPPPPERQYFIVDSFSFPTTTTTEEASSSSYGGNGNPAAVVLMNPTDTIENINPKWCQHIAAEFNVSETAFVWKRKRRKNRNEKTKRAREETASLETEVTDLEDTEDLDTKEYEYDIRYYTPDGTEIDLCGHATLAAGRVLLESVATREVVFRTKHGLRLPVSASVPSSSGASSSSASPVAIHMQLPWKNTLPYPVTSEPYAEVVTMLQDSFGGTGVGNQNGGPLSPEDILFVGAGEDQEDLLVELTPAAFAHLPATEHINFAPMVAYAGAPQRGLIVCCAGPGKAITAAAPDSTLDDIDFQSRFFGPKVGIPEDPVTGSAHCLLGPYFGTKLHQACVRGYQASARGGLVTCRLHPPSSLSSLGRDHPEPHGRVELVGQAVVVMQGTVCV